MWYFPAEFSCVPIFTEDESLKSIVISELDFSTEPSTSSEKLPEPEMSESFNELHEKYDKLFIKNSTDVPDDEYLPHKRSPGDAEGGTEREGKSVIEKVENIVDPEVKKEFELEFSKSGKVDVEDKNSLDSGTEYDPNYAEKIVNADVIKLRNVNDVQPGPSQLDVAEAGKAIDDQNSNQLEIDSSSSTQADDQQLSTGFSTNPPSLPEVIEVFEVVFHLPSESDIDQVTPMSLNVQVDFDPIEVVKKEETSRNVDFEVTTLPNDKFVGYQPNEDLVEPGEENTEPDHFFQKPVTPDTDEETVEQAADRLLIETLKYVALYGKSLNVGDVEKDIATTEAFEQFVTATSLPQIPETKTEIVEVNTEFSISFQTDESIKKPEDTSSDSNLQSSVSEKSSEENDSKGNEKDEKIKKVNKESSESSDENNAEEKVDADDLRIFSMPAKETQNYLMEDLYHGTMTHGVTKKDEPQNVQLTTEKVQRTFNAEDGIAQQFEEKLQKEEDTTVGVYETFEDVVTTVSDGIKLSNEFRDSIDTFRHHAKENKTFLDTNSEVISSKNLKASLVDVAEGTAEGIILESRAEKAPYFVMGIVGLTSVALALTLFVIVKRLRRNL